MEPKSWLDSLTIRGQILQVVPALYAICRVFGLNLPDGVFEALLNGISAVLFLVGAVMTVIGRFRATQPLK